MERYEEYLQQIAKLDKEIEDLTEYRSDINPRNWAIDGKGSLMSRFRYHFNRRQILRHLQYLRLQRALVQDSYEKFERRNSNRQPEG